MYRLAQGGYAMSGSSMRDAMPSVAAWVDELRQTFGAETINPQLRQIYASENGRTIGQQKPYKHAVAVSGMPDIVALLERKQTAPAVYKHGKRKR